MITTTPTRRFSRDEYYAMARTGILKPTERVELLHGEVIAMSPQGSSHAAIVGYFAKTLQAAFGNHVTIRVQAPLMLGEDSEPEPALAVVTGQPLEYVTHHPATALLVVEIAETSLLYDRSTKAQLYAEHLIPEYWIVNIPDRHVEVFRSPSKSGYEMHTILPADNTITPLHTPEFTLLLTDVFSSLR